MRLVFMGTPAFAVPSLRALATAHEVAAVYTQPDRGTGRGRRVTPSAVKQMAEELGVPVHQPQTLRDPAELDILREYAPDVVCVAAYGLILPPEVLAIPGQGCVNVHASLLPRHRGAAPVHRAILEGDTETGVSIMRMEEGLDTGPVALKTAVPVGDDSVDDLTSHLADLGAQALLTVLDRMEHGHVEWEPQDDTAATYAAKVSRADVALDPTLSVLDAHRRVRASTRSAPSRACVDGRLVTVVRVSRSSEDVSQGGVLASRRDLVLGFADGALSLEEIRPEGRGCMDGACFARGSHLDASAAWEACP